MKTLSLILAFMFLVLIPYYSAKFNNQKVVIDNIVDIKDFKKLLRTKTNVLVCFVSGMKQASHVIKVFKETAATVKGQGTMILVDCSGEAKKMCKKLKVAPEPVTIKHYKDGDFHKDYDRKETVASMVNFMRDPTGDIPWEEDVSASDVMHIPDANNLAKFIKKEQKPILIMFYAPWCGFCKTLKPDYSAAATELQGHSILAAIDVNRPENAVIRTQYNITGFPTLLYFVNGAMKYQYEGDNNKNAIVQFMKNPHMPAVKVKEPEWSDTDSEVVHLTNQSFDLVIKEEASVLVMFYAPWCGHCKRMKPEYEAAAAKMKTNGISGMLAALDATKEPVIANRFGVKGYPTVKYFVYGELKFDINVRESQKIIDFMQDPKQPPPPPPPEKPWAEEVSNVIHLNEEDFQIFLKKKKHVLVMFYAPWCGHCKRAKPEFSKAAEHFQDNLKVEFAAVDCTVNQAVCSSQGVKGYPTFKYFSYFKIVKPYDGGRLATDFKNFMRSMDKSQISDTQPLNNEMQSEDKKKDGKQNEKKSDDKNKDGKENEKIPDEKKATDTDDIKKWVVENAEIMELTDNNFGEKTAKQLTLVMFYAPWCKHCKTLKPVYYEVANLLKKRNLPAKLAVIDCTEHPEVADEQKIVGFPTMKLFREGKFLKDFVGKRTTDDLIAFIEANVEGKQPKVADTTPSTAKPTAQKKKTPINPEKKKKKDEL